MQKELPKNTVLTEAGRSPWYGTDGQPKDCYIIGIGGGSASGKTRVAQAILKNLGVPWVLCIAQDNFYKTLSPEQSKNAFENNHDFDSPDSFDHSVLKSCLEDLKANRSVQIPNYSFILHQRTSETTYLYGATIVIVEGIFALHDKAIRDLCDLKVFVQCDSDLMLARRLRRDIVERGRDCEGVLDQYLRFVKPSFDEFVQPTSKYADVIVPGMNNETSIALITSHIRRQLDERKVELRSELYRNNIVTPAASPLEGSFEKEFSHASKPTTEDSPKNLRVLQETPQIRGIHTILRNVSTSRVDFQFFADRISTLVIEYALSFLPSRPKPIVTRTQIPHEGQELAIPREHLCGVSILRSGSSLERGLRRVIREASIGSILIQSDDTSGESLLYHLSLPACLTSTRKSAESSTVLLLDSQIGTGSSAIMGIRILLDHGVKEENILFVCILVSRVGGIWAIQQAFPQVRIVTSAVDDGLEERWQIEGERGPKKVFAITPGLGSFGERYYGA